MEMCVNTEKKWEHLGKGQDGRPLGLSCLRKTQMLCPSLGTMGGLANHVMVEGRQGIKGRGAGSLPYLSPLGQVTKSF